MDFPSPETTSSSAATSPPPPALVTTGSVAGAAATTTAVPPAVPQAKILSRNVNGTIVWTSSPNNEAELQLYRVMQRASLLAYYDTLLEMGGDDVQQLCDAGEEEFLEIMALVGMASKPLHVRRLQKALQEWLTNPAMFRSPLVPGGGFSPRPVGPTPSLVLSPLLASMPHQPPPHIAKDTPPLPPPPTSPLLTDGICPGESPGRPPSSGGPSPGPPGSPLLHQHQHPPPVLLEAQVAKLAEAAQHLVNTLPQMEPKSHTAKKKMNKDLEQVLSMAEDDPRRMELIRKFAAIYGRFDCKRKPEKPLTLHEVSVNEAAAQICRFMPALLTRRDELFPLARQVVRDSGYHYSKGHSKSFAKGYNGDHSHSKRAKRDYSPESEETIRKRQERLDQIADELRIVNERTQGLLDGTRCGKGSPSSPVNGSPRGDGSTTVQTQVEALQTRQQALLNEQSQLVSQSLQPNRLFRQNSCGKIYADSDKIDTDDTDSQLSFSNESSPLPEVGDSRDSMSRGEYDGVSSSCDRTPPPPPSLPPQTAKLSNNQGIDDRGKNHREDGFDDSFFRENKVQVIASSGGNIIAVANPALSMSPAIIDNGRNNLIKKDALTIDPKLA